MDGRGPDPKVLSMAAGGGSAAVQPRTGPGHFLHQFSTAVPSLNWFRVMKSSSSSSLNWLTFYCIQSCYPLATLAYNHSSSSAPMAT